MTELQSALLLRRQLAGEGREVGRGLGGGLRLLLTQRKVGAPWGKEAGYPGSGWPGGREKRKAAGAGRGVGSTFRDGESRKNFWKEVRGWGEGTTTCGHGTGSGVSQVSWKGEKGCGGGAALKGVGL